MLEIGVGMGADLVRWAKPEPRLSASISPGVPSRSPARLEREGLGGAVHVADAEKLPFADGCFDIAWSWGVFCTILRKPIRLWSRPREFSDRADAMQLWSTTDDLGSPRLWSTTDDLGSPPRPGCALHF